jgi:hypothetical protein
MGTKRFYRVDTDIAGWNTCCAVGIFRLIYELLAGIYFMYADYGFHKKQRRIRANKIACGAYRSRM